MTPETTEAPSRWSSLVAFLARARASVWGAIAVRVIAVVVGLIVLGWIGRTAAAGPSTSVSVSTTERDASTTPTVALEAGVVPIATAAPAPVTTGGARGRATPAEPVYLNQASVDELRRLPGVGPKRAEAILVLRQRLGRFHRLEDLLRVKGVGRNTVKKWRPLVKLEAPSVPDAG
jgi:competence protein ComEA